MLGRKLFELEDRFDFVTGVRGKGLLWGVEFRREMAEEVTLACLEGGLIVNNVRPNVLRLSPPLIVSDEELEQGLAILESVLAAGYELEKASEPAFEREWVSKEDGASEDVRRNEAEACSATMVFESTWRTLWLRRLSLPTPAASTPASPSAG